MKPMLTATNIIEYSKRLELGSYETIDQFLLSELGIDYNKLPFYHELKTVLENTMQRITIDHGTYKSYQWIDK